MINSSSSPHMHEQRKFQATKIQKTKRPERFLNEHATFLHFCGNTFYHLTPCGNERPFDFGIQTLRPEQRSDSLSAFSPEQYGTVGQCGFLTNGSTVFFLHGIHKVDIMADLILQSGRQPTTAYGGERVRWDSHQPGNVSDRSFVVRFRGTRLHARCATLG